MSDSDDIYRKDAWDHYLSAHEFGAVTRVSPPWTWAILLLSLAAVGGALLLSIVTRIEVPHRAPGILTTSGRVVSYLSILPKDGFVDLQVAGGTVRGRIDDIDRRPASAQEVRAALGANARLAGPLHRVAISILPVGANAIPPAPGMPVEVRYVRRDRILLIFFAPLRRWLDG